MESIVDGIAQQAEGIAPQEDGFAQLTELEVKLNGERVALGDFVDNFSRKFYKDFGAAGLDWCPGDIRKLLIPDIPLGS